MMIREKSVPEISGSGDDQAIVGDLPEYSGNSAAFTSSPCEGVTVSAEEGAFKEDTVVSFTKLDELPEQFSELIEELTDQMILPIYAWEVDAGLEDDEVIPVLSKWKSIWKRSESILITGPPFPSPGSAMMAAFMNMRQQ